MSSEFIVGSLAISSVSSGSSVLGGSSSSVGPSSSVLESELGASCDLISSSVGPSSTVTPDWIN